MLLVNRRIPAFSLIEMLVVMILSSIMVGIIYFVFYTVNSYQVSLSRKYSEIENLNSVYSQLSYDVDRSEFLVARASNSLTCTVQHTGIEIVYSFFPNYIIRTQSGRIDSLASPGNSVVFLFKQKIIEDGLVDEMKIEMKYFGAIQKLSYLKQYDAAVLVSKVQPDIP